MLLHLSFKLQIGKTKVFLRAGQIAELDAHRAEALGHSAKIIQRKVLAYQSRKKYLMLQSASTEIQAFCRGNTCCIPLIFLGSDLVSGLISLFPQDMLHVVSLSPWEEKLLLWEFRSRPGLIYARQPIKGCVFQLFMFRLVCVQGLLELNFNTERREERQSLFKQVWNLILMTVIFHLFWASITCKLLIPQSQVRRFFCRRRFLRMKKAAVTTQCGWRVKVARRELLKLKMVSLLNFYEMSWIFNMFVNKWFLCLPGC